MDGHTWLAFVLASAVMGVAPGPGVTSIVGYAIGSGRRTALASVAGMATGNAVASPTGCAPYGAARQEVGRYLNNRAQASHQPSDGENGRCRGSEDEDTQTFASVHGTVHDHFNQERH